MEERKPNLFIVGAAKAGTTFLHEALSNHTQINCAIVKEPGYFCTDIRINNFPEPLQKKFQKRKIFDKSGNVIPHHNYFFSNIDDYLKCFDFQSKYKYFVDSSPAYLYSKVAAKKIFEYNPNAKIIIIRRDPVDRAISHLKMNLLTFKDIQPSTIIATDHEFGKSSNYEWGCSNLYIELGKYYEQFKRYIEIFPKKNILIIDFKELSKGKEKLQQELSEFLQIENLYLPLQKTNESKQIKYQIFTHLIRITRKYNIQELLPKNFKSIIKSKLSAQENAIKLSEDDRLFLYSFFEEDINKLENLLRHY